MAADVSRYKTILKIASGGTASVWIGAVRGGRALVAIKKPHPQIFDRPGVRSELMAEVRLAALIRHPNVVDVKDVIVEGNDVALVMDYVEGASLQDLLAAAVKNGERISPRVLIRAVIDACAGLHAAHELRDETNRPVGLVHREISPQKILVGLDGIARVTDFGVAKFSRRNVEPAETGGARGKLAYMAPEFVRGEVIDRRFDVFALGAILWEGLCWTRCFRGATDAETVNRLLTWGPPRISEVVPELGPDLDDVVATALEKHPDKRFRTSAAFAQSLDAAARASDLLGSHEEVAKTISELLGPAIEARRAIIQANLVDDPSLGSMIAEPRSESWNRSRAAQPEPLQGPTLPDEATVIVQPVGDAAAALSERRSREEGSTGAGARWSVSGRRAAPDPALFAPDAPTVVRQRGRHDPTVMVRPREKELFGAPMWLVYSLGAFAGVALLGVGLMLVVIVKRSEAPAAEPVPTETRAQADPPRLPETEPEPEPAPVPSAAPLVAPIVTAAPTAPTATAAPTVTAERPRPPPAPPRATPPAPTATGKKKPPPNPYP